VKLAALAVSLVLALDGESANSNTGVAVLSLVSIVCGYVVLAALWYFVFRGKARARRKKGPSD
jgi:hypothetical protein